MSRLATTQSLKSWNKLNKKSKTTIYNAYSNSIAQYNQYVKNYFSNLNEIDVSFNLYAQIT